MCVKVNLKDISIYVNRILRDEEYITLYYEIISDFIIQSFYFGISYLKCMDTFAITIKWNYYTCNK